ncbi:MAG TPA: 7-cyano-7-deazaguanine synthase QueC [Methanomassiliicoccales archaeon]|nr:7-cyano-7-deazaguanine synthase QueC [Methanomassiliicoccales archaeon]
MVKAVALLSGGLDSTVTLARAVKAGDDVTALSFRYGQRHQKELDSARKVAEHYGTKHVIVDLDLSSFTSSALTSKELPVPERKDASQIGEDIPVTYVPSRNIIFLSVASGLAETIGADRIYIGANALDYSGYPDCRPEFFQAFEKVLAVGTKRGVEGRPVRVVTPILRLTKAEIVKLGVELDAPLELTWSCYVGGAKACGRCDSCLLRLKGFREAGLKDPIEYEVRQ